MITGVGLVLLSTIAPYCFGQGPTAQYSDPCMRHNDCVGELVCCNYECMCSPRTRYVGHGRCAPVETPKKPVGQPCNSDSECIGSYTSCQDRFCQCNYAYAWDESIRDCRQPAPRLRTTTHAVSMSKQIGEACTTGYECIGYRTNCNYYVCQCDSGYSWVPSESDCARVAPTSKPHGSYCTGDSECRDVLVCLHQRCECPYGFTYDEVNDRCRAAVVVQGFRSGSRRFAQSCTKLPDCAGALWCVNSRCTCLSGFEHDGFSGCNEVREVIRTFGDPCVSSSECAGALLCINSRCACTGHTRWDGSDCVTNSLPREFGRSCLVSSDCDGILLCISNVCKCPVGMQWDGRRCTPIIGTIGRRAKGYGESCSGSSMDCNSSIGLVCLRNKCDCSESNFWNGNRCQVLKGNGDACLIDVECLGALLCTNHICRCPSGTQWDGNDCKAPTGVIGRAKGYGETCTRSTDCNSNIGLGCIQNKCDCSENNFWNGNRCQRKKGYGEACVWAIECIGYLGCWDNICSCGFAMRVRADGRSCQLVV